MEEWHIYNARLGTGVGHEQQNERPCIVVKDLGSGIGLCIVIPLTSNIDALRFPYAVSIGKGEANLAFESIAMLFHIRSVSFERLGMEIGELPMGKVAKIKGVLKLMLELK